jgi:hypothetical protein
MAKLVKDHQKSVTANGGQPIDIITMALTQHQQNLKDIE